MGDLFGVVVVRPLGLILLQVYKLLGSYGLSIILFAILVKIFCIPFAVKGKKSMLAMSALSKEQQALQKKYGNNREKFNEELQKLYEKNNVSPASGCLPQFIPLLFMMGLYYAVQKPLTFLMGLGGEAIDKISAIIGINAQNGGFYYQIKMAEELGKLGQNGFSQDILDALGGRGELLAIDFNFLGLNLAETPNIRAFGIIWLLPLLSGLTAFVYAMVMMKVNEKNNPAMANGQMKLMNYITPLMSLYFAFIMPGAISIYWIFNNLFSCGQELVLSRILQRPEVEGLSEDKKKKKKKPEGEQ